jgi:hypothetical protein
MRITGSWIGCGARGKELVGGLQLLTRGVIACAPPGSRFTGRSRLAAKHLGTIVRTAQTLTSSEDR